MHESQLLGEKVTLNFPTKQALMYGPFAMGHLPLYVTELFPLFRNFFFDGQVLNSQFGTTNNTVSQPQSTCLFTRLEGV